MDSREQSRTLFWLLMIVFCILFSGCAKLNKFTDEELSGGYSAAKLVDINRSVSVYNDIKTKWKGSENCFADYNDYLVTETNDKYHTKKQNNKKQDIKKQQIEEYCKSQRNRVVSLLMIESTYLCTDHLNGIYGKEAAYNIATGSIAAFTAGLAAVSTGGQASSMAALSAFASAERSLFNETVYKNMLTTAIGTKIKEMREQKGNALLAKRNNSFDSYSMESAIQDVFEYHESCSFRKGLEVALEEGTATTPAVKRSQLEVKAQSLMNQILVYAKNNRKEPKEYQLKNGSTDGIEDPFLKTLVEQYISVNREIVALSPATPTGSKKTPATDASPGM